MICISLYWVVSRQVLMTLLSCCCSYYIWRSITERETDFKQFHYIHGEEGSFGGYYKTHRRKPIAQFEFIIFVFFLSRTALPCQVTQLYVSNSRFELIASKERERDIYHFASTSEPNVCTWSDCLFIISRHLTKLS